MSWSELERLVTDAEISQDLKQTLSQCRSRQELLQTARQLGYRLTRADLDNAWLEHHNASAVNGAGAADRWAAASS
jgi:hypothetical protein